MKKVVIHKNRNGPGYPFSLPTDVLMRIHELKGRNDIELTQDEYGNPCVAGTGSNGEVIHYYCYQFYHFEERTDKDLVQAVEEYNERTKFAHKETELKVIEVPDDTHIRIIDIDDNEFVCDARYMWY